jgi:hypothetical protein
MTYDYNAKSIVLQDSRVWISGLSDEAGAGSFLAATMKQSIQPDANEMAKLESFVDGVLWGKIQTTNYAVRKSIFYHQPSSLPGYKYDPTMDWTSWTSWDQSQAYATDRTYDYVHVVAAYWAMYRAGRAYPTLLKSHTWDWYLNQSYSTVMKATEVDSRGNYVTSYAGVGLMGESVFGELLEDLRNEGWTSQASALEASMKKRATLWNSQSVPFGSEMAWDSTGQEGVYYWSR